MDAPEGTNDDQSGSRRRFNVGEFLAVLLVVGITFAAVQQGLSGRGEWSIVFTLGTVSAAILFRDKRQRPWFWPTFLALAALHALLVVAMDWQPFGSEEGPRAMGGAVLVDCCLNCLALYWMDWRSDPARQPRTSASLVVEATLLAAVLIVAGIVTLLVWAIDGAEKRNIAQGRVVFERASAYPMNDLTKCLEQNARDAWRPVANRYHAERMTNPILASNTIVVDTGAQRVVTISTLRGRPLTPPELKVIDRCLALGASS